MPSPRRPSGSGTPREADDHPHYVASSSNNGQEQQEDSSKPQPRERNDSSSTIDSGISMESLNATLPRDSNNNGQEEDALATKNPKGPHVQHGYIEEESEDGLDSYANAL